MKAEMNRTELAPIILFVYRRLDHAMEVIDALRANPEAADSRLLVFSDGGKDEQSWEEVRQVREYLHSVDGFAQVEIVEREENWGIERSEIEGIGSVVGKYGKVIVLEDDIVVSKFFLRFVNDALDRYASCKNVCSVTGYSFIPAGEHGSLPEYAFTQLTSAWGWGTWKDRWDRFAGQLERRDFQALLSRANRRRFDHGYSYTGMMASQYRRGHVTWDILWYWTAFRNGWVTLFPTRTMVNNIGMDGSGEHYTDVSGSNRIESLDEKRSLLLPDEIRERPEVRQRITQQLERIAAPGSKAARRKAELRTWLLLLYGWVKSSAKRS